MCPPARRRRVLLLFVAAATASAGVPPPAAIADLDAAIKAEKPEVRGCRAHFQTGRRCCGPAARQHGGATCLCRPQVWAVLSPRLHRYWEAKAAETAQRKPAGAEADRTAGGSSELGLQWPSVLKSEAEVAASDLLTIATDTADTLGPATPLHCAALQLLLGGGQPAQPVQLPGILLLLRAKPFRPGPARQLPSNWDEQLRLK